jgi:hypothetical protein
MAINKKKRNKQQHKKDWEWIKRREEGKKNKIKWGANTPTILIPIFQTPNMPVMFALMDVHCGSQQRQVT